MIVKKLAPSTLMKLISETPSEVAHGPQLELLNWNTCSCLLVGTQLPPLLPLALQAYQFYSSSSLRNVVGHSAPQAAFESMMMSVHNNLQYCKAACAQSHT